FQMTPAGELTTLHAFASDCSDGCDFGLGFNLTQASDGNFYGTRLNGGSGNQGTIFRITPDGIFTTLHSFIADCAEGCSPFGGLVQANDGNLYGTTVIGGAGGVGTVFRVTTGGDFT